MEKLYANPTANTRDTTRFLTVEARQERIVQVSAMLAVCVPKGNEWSGLHPSLLEGFPPPHTAQEGEAVGNRMGG